MYILIQAICYGVNVSIKRDCCIYFSDVIGWHTPTYSIVMQQCHSHTNTGIVFWCVSEVYHQSSDVLQTSVPTPEQRKNCKQL